MNSPSSPSLLRKEGAQDTVCQEHSPSLQSREGEKKGVSSCRQGGLKGKNRKIVNILE
jgi:hypothetical protein